jgi:sugar lactone lactonase YvrE
MWTTLAGTAGAIGTADGPAEQALFYQPYGITADTAGNLYVADTLNNTVRKLTPVGADWQVSTLAGNAFVPPGLGDGANDGALFNHPAGIASDNTGGLYISDFNNNAIRKMTLTSGSWVVTTLAGNGASGTNNGTGSSARFFHPTGLAVDSAGSVYVADEGNHAIRKLTQSGGNWVVTTIAGRPGMSGTIDGTNNNARFSSPWSIVAADSSTLYVTDFGSSRIRKLALVGGNWVVTTIAGSTPGSVDGTGSGAQFSYPMGLTWTSDQSLYITDFGGDTIRKLTPSGTNWVASTLGGTASSSGSSDGVGSAAQFFGPRGVAAIGTSLFVTDSINNTVRLGQPALELQISLSGNQLILTCPSAASGFELQSTTNLTSGIWSKITSGFTISGNNFILPRDPAAPPTFYRLKVGQAGLLLQISLSGNQLILTCPSPATNYTLQSTTSLNPAVWSTVTSGVTISGNNFILSRNPGAPPTFFRLSQ